MNLYGNFDSLRLDLSGCLNVEMSGCLEARDPRWQGVRISCMNVGA